MLNSFVFNNDFNNISKKKKNHFLFSVAAMQQRFSHDHGHSTKEIGPPASFNQLPHPEGDWAENHGKKQTKYNAIMAGSALFFAATFGFVSTSHHSSVYIRQKLITFQLILLFSLFFTVERIRYYLLQCLSTRYIRIKCLNC